MQPYWIDTLCHLYASPLSENQAHIYQHALQHHVKKIIIPATHSHAFHLTQQTKQYQGCYQAYGLHPLYINTHEPHHLDLLKQFLLKENAIAIGEVGLDGMVPNLDQQKQLDFFYAQLKLARELDLPIILHIRKAQDAILKGLRQFRPKGGVAHAFNGSLQQAEQFIKLGFKLGFGGAMTYDRALNIRRLATILPLESIVLETDAPDIPPSFAPKIPNEPAHLPHIGEVLAILRQTSWTSIAQQTSANAEAIFQI